MAGRLAPVVLVAAVFEAAVLFADDFEAVDLGPIQQRFLQQFVCLAFYSWKRSKQIRLQWRLVFQNQIVESLRSFGQRTRQVPRSRPLGERPLVSLIRPS